MTQPVPPGSTIGILGGGQLGRMLAMAAARLGYRCHIYAPEVPSVAAEAAAAHTAAAWDDAAALDRFARQVSVVTYEFENVPEAAVARLEGLVPVRPGRQALATAQDRAAEKAFARAQGGATPAFALVDGANDLDAALAATGLPAILKTRRSGYDGKGQRAVATPAEALAACRALGPGLILEARVPFDFEFSLLLARGLDGDIRAYDACENHHEGGILARTRLPAARLLPAHRDAALRLVERIAAGLDYVGLLACEFFATANGPLFNEMAPRVHNSGHWTIEGARTSQFEQHVRAVCGLPLGPCDRLADRIEMENLLGDDWRRWPAILAEPGAHLHLYGKGDDAPGRKMGHVTRLLP